ncbi:MAG TPA: hypothetical protein VKA91_10520 [Nitrososphaeraceae archaeon]|nr:hypothetical protein [Nitrososphaeraceae archaeon]
MVKFEMIINGTEDMVFTKTASHIISVGSTQIDVGDHCVTFSGNGKLTDSHVSQLKSLADQLGDTTAVVYQGEIIVGPTWRVVYQCSFIVAPGYYINYNSDQDDWQAWGITKDKWDLAPVGAGKKRIRLSFTASQNGQNTVFSGIVYQVTATGILETPHEK